MGIDDFGPAGVLMTTSKLGLPSELKSQLVCSLPSHGGLPVVRVTPATAMSDGAPPTRPTHEAPDVQHADLGHG
jgi:hypothetical protein